MRRVQQGIQNLGVTRTFLALGLTCGVLVLWPERPAEAVDVNWRQFEGKTLRVLLLSQSPWQPVIGTYLPEFEELTGIKLAIEVHQQANLWNVLETGLKEPGRVDVFMTVPALDGRRYLRMGGIHPVNDFLRDPTLTAKEYRWEDFFARAREAMEIDGTILGPPIMAEHLALLYRKDLFQQHKVAVPRTLEELEAAARFFHRKPIGNSGEGLAGIVARGQGPLATSLYAGVLHAMGTTWVDGNNRPTVNSPKGLAALQYLGNLLRQYGPPNVSDYGWQEASSLFREEKAAIYAEGSSIYPIVEQNSTSRVVGKVGYAVFPSGPGGSGTTVAVRGLAIAKASANPKAAWLFLQWASSPKMVERALIRGVLVSRESTWKDRSLYRGEIPDDLALSFQEAGRTGTSAWAPPLVSIVAAREALGKAITAAIRGENVKAAADTAARQLSELLLTTEGASPRATRARQ
jgi:multiple sugar transport system substrate-binding protein